MPVLLKADKSPAPLTDAAGNPLKTGQTMTDEMFGDAIVRGTVPLDRGEGLNVVLYWLGPKDASKPKSRGANHLTAKYASGDAETRTRMHTGAEYESGAVYEARDRNDADAGVNTAIAEAPTLHDDDCDSDRVCTARLRRDNATDPVPHCMLLLRGCGLVCETVTKLLRNTVCVSCGNGSCECTCPCEML